MKVYGSESWMAHSTSSRSMVYIGGTSLGGIFIRRSVRIRPTSFGPVGERRDGRLARLGIVEDLEAM